MIFASKSQSGPNVLAHLDGWMDSGHVANSLKIHYTAKVNEQNSGTKNIKVMGSIPRKQTY